MKKHHYWVSYQTANKDGSFGFGACDINIGPGKIRTGTDVQKIRDFILKERSEIKNAVIMNFVFLRTEVTKKKGKRK